MAIGFADTSPDDKQGNTGYGSCPDGYRWTGSGCEKIRSTGADVEAIQSQFLEKRKQQAAKDAITEAEASQKASTELAGTYDDYLAATEADIKATPGRAAAAGAQALAPVFGQFGMGASAATPAAALAGAQVSQQAQRAAAAQLRKLKDDLQSGKISQKEAEMAAHDLGIQVKQMIMEQPDPTEFRSGRDADYQEKWNQAVEGAKGWLNDDEEAVFKVMKTALANEQDPVLRTKWMRRACGALKGGQAGTDWCSNNGFQIGLENI